MLVTERLRLHDEIGAWVEKHGATRAALIPVLQEIQRGYREISEYAMQEVADRLDIHPVEENLPLIMVVETRDQVGQRRLAATGTPDQRHHLPCLGGKADVVQDLLVSAWIGKTQLANFDTPTDALALLAAMIDFWLLIQLLEDTFRGSDTFLHRRADFRELANGLGQQTCQSNVGHQVTRTGITTQQQHEEHQHRHGAVDHQLQAGRIDRIGLDHLQLLATVFLTGVMKTLLLVSLATETAHHAIALDGLGGDMRDIAHGYLDLLALLAKLLAGAADHQTNQRQDRQHHQGQLPVHPQQ